MTTLAAANELRKINQVNWDSNYEGPVSTVRP